MFPRRIAQVAVLTVAAGGLYIATETEFGREWTGYAVSQTAINRGQTGNARGPTQRYPVHAHYEVETLRDIASDEFRYDETLAKKLGAFSSDGPLPSLAGNNVPDIRHALRFDLTSSAILQRFSRVSTVLADLQLEGLRVPVVTGTRADDLAGTLTYYLDRAGKIQRISLHGFTGDPNRLTQTLQQHYGLQAEPNLEAGVYTRRWNGLPVHLLRLTHAPVVHSDAVHQKFTVFLELNQPNLAYGISDEARRIVQTDRWTGRW
ncbi:MAG: DUF6690 family protein [Planctomycetota bacterium]